MEKRIRLTPRELIQPHDGDKRYTRRIAKGQPGGGQFYGNQDDVSKSLSRDVRQHSKRVVKSGQGDRGDQKCR